MKHLCLILFFITICNSTGYAFAETIDYYCQDNYGIHGRDKTVDIANNAYLDEGINVSGFDHTINISGGVIGVDSFMSDEPWWTPISLSASAWRVNLSISGGSFEGDIELFVHNSTVNIYGTDLSDNLINWHTHHITGTLSDGTPIDLTLNMPGVGNVLNLNTPLPLENGAPIITSISPMIVKEYDVIDFVVKTSDPDGDSVSLSIENMPEFAVFHPDGSFYWVPNYSQAGIYPITFIATDNGTPAKSAKMTVTITVYDISPQALTENIIESYSEDDSISESVVNSYNANLKKVSGFIDEGKIKETLSQLTAFQSKVNRDVEQGNISVSKGEDLIEMSKEITLKLSRPVSIDIDIEKLERDALLGAIEFIPGDISLIKIGKDTFDAIELIGLMLKEDFYGMYQKTANMIFSNLIGRYGNIFLATADISTYLSKSIDRELIDRANKDVIGLLLYKQLNTGVPEFSFSDVRSNITGMGILEVSNVINALPKMVDEGLLKLTKYYAERYYSLTAKGAISLYLNYFQEEKDDPFWVIGGKTAVEKAQENEELLKNLANALYRN